MSTYPTSVSIAEVLPRDGLQRHETFVPTEEKIAIVETLASTGISEIEVTSFAHPEAVPQLRDAEAVFDGLTRDPAVTYSALVPNETGMNRAIDAEVDKANALVSASETYSRRNQGMRVEEAIREVERVVDIAASQSVPVEASISMCFFCPYEGEITPDHVLEVVDSVIAAGVDEVSLATSMGMAHPRQVADLLKRLTESHPNVEPSLHLHDTNGMSLANALVAMQHGVDSFDSSACGLGGGVILPDELTNVGNTPTEDLVNMLREIGIDTGIDFDELLAAARNVADRLGVEPESHALRGGTRAAVLEASAPAE